MMFLLRIAAFLFLVWVLYQLVKSVLLTSRSKSGSVPGGDAPRIAEMFRDPVCGSYVSADHAVTADFAGERKYFCSEKCRDEYDEAQQGG